MRDFARDRARIATASVVLFSGANRTGQKHCERRLLFVRARSEHIDCMRSASLQSYCERWIWSTNIRTSLFMGGRPRPTHVNFLDMTFTPRIVLTVVRPVTVNNDHRSRTPGSSWSVINWHSVYSRPRSLLLASSDNHYYCIFPWLIPNDMTQCHICNERILTIRCMSNRNKTRTCNH